MDLRDLLKVISQHEDRKNIQKSIHDRNKYTDSQSKRWVQKHRERAGEDAGNVDNDSVAGLEQKPCGIFGIRRILEFAL